MNCCELANCISHAPGHPRIVDVSAWHELNRRVVQDNKILSEVVRRMVLGNHPTIHIGEAHELFRRVTQQIHLGGVSNVFISEGCP